MKISHADIADKADRTDQTDKKHVSKRGGSLIKNIDTKKKKEKKRKNQRKKEKKWVVDNRF